MSSKRTHILKITDEQVTINDDGDVMVADIIICNAQGCWYGVDLGLQHGTLDDGAPAYSRDSGDWEYLQDNGAYITAPAAHRRITDEFFL